MLDLSSSRNYALMTNEIPSSFYLNTIEKIIYYLEIRGYSLRINENNDYFLKYVKSNTAVEFFTLNNVEKNLNYDVVKFVENLIPKFTTMDYTTQTFYIGCIIYLLGSDLNKKINFLICCDNLNYSNFKTTTKILIDLANMLSIKVINLKVINDYNSSVEYFLNDHKL